MEGDQGGYPPLTLDRANPLGRVKAKWEDALAQYFQPKKLPRWGDVSWRGVRRGVWVVSKDGFSHEELADFRSKAEAAGVFRAGELGQPERAWELTVKDFLSRIFLDPPRQEALTTAANFRANFLRMRR